MSTPSRKTILLATDQQQSVLNALTANQPHPIAYSPYGHRAPENGLLSLLGFNGELPDSLTGHYHLGKGYRQFNPVLMRFNSPDSWSPFGEGGLNAYAYGGGDPRNSEDPTGHVAVLYKWLHVASQLFPPAPPLPPRKPPPLLPRAPRLPISSKAVLPPPPALPPRGTPQQSIKPKKYVPTLPKGSFLTSEETLVIPSNNNPDHAWFIPVSETEQSVEQLIKHGAAPPPKIIKGKATPPPVTGGPNINYAFEPDDAPNSRIRRS